MNLTWAEVLEARYATRLDARQVEVWEHFLKEINTNSAELTTAINMASNCDLRPAEWRCTVTDLIKWVKMTRAKSIRVKENGTRATPEETIKQFKENCIARLTDGSNIKLLIDEAWCLPGLLDSEVKEVIKWIKEMK